MGNPNSKEFTKVKSLSGLKDLPVEPESSRNPTHQEQPYLDREGLRELIANSPVPKGIPDIHAPESREPLAKNIPKNSRVAFILAFYYRQSPKDYNSPKYKVVDLQSYLHWALQEVEKGNEEVLNSLPEDCRSKEDCLKQMSSEEMTALVNEWKKVPEPDEGYYKQCDEYLEYLLRKQDDSEEKKEEVGQTPESEFKAELVTIDESRLPYTLRAEVKVLGKDEKHFFIHLPPAARVASLEEKQKYVEAFRQVLVGTEGKFFPRFDAEDNKLVVSMGPSSKRSTWQTVDEYSVEELAELTGKSEKEAEAYIILREKNWTMLSEQEKKERDDFELTIRNVRQKAFVSVNEVSFDQAMRDLMIAKRWIASIGESRYAELEKLAQNTTVEKNKNRWGVNDELLNNPEFQAKAKGFLDLIKKRFDSWEKVLGPKSVLSELSTVARLKGTEALYLLGKEALTGARQEFLAEYEKLFNLSAEDLKQYIKEHPLTDAPENETLTKAKILKLKLLEYVHLRPMDGDIWNAKKTNRLQTQGPEYLPEISLADRKSTLFNSLSPEALDRIFNKTFPQG